MTREEREKLREKAKEYVGSYMETHLIEAKDTLALLDHCDTLEARCEKLEQALMFIADKKVSSPCVIEILQAYEERASQALAHGKETLDEETIQARKDWAEGNYWNSDRIEKISQKLRESIEDCKKKRSAGDSDEKA